MTTLVATGAAIGAGCAAVRLGFVDSGRGHMVALRWYVGRVAFPLLLFRVVVTADIGNVHWYLIVSCTLGKLCVMLPMWLIAFCFYHHGNVATSQRVLTATCFAFFTVASDDFALGFPVVQSLYAPEDGMDLYIAANALVSNSVFMPIVMVGLEVGKAMMAADTEDPKDMEAVADSGESEGDGESDDDGESDVSWQSEGTRRPTTRSQIFPSWGGLLVHRVSTTVTTVARSSALLVAGRIVKSILANPVILCMASGALYKLFFGTYFPPIVDAIVQKLTSPFGTMALFATGTVLKPPSLKLWPCMLSVFKVVICAYASFLIARETEPPGGLERLTDFSFFYGSIPTSSAALLFTVQYDPSAVDTVASATLFGLFLAGPLMLSTSLFIEEANLNPDILDKMQRWVSICSFVFGVAFCVLLLALVVCGRWGFSTRGKTSLAAYGVAATIYTFLMWRISFEPCGADGGVPDSTEAVLVAFLGRYCRTLVVLMEALTVPWSGECKITVWLEAALVGLIFLVTAASALVMPAPESMNMACNINLPDHTYLFKICWGVAYVAVLAGLGLVRMRMRARGRVASGDTGHELWGHDWRLVPPTTVVRALVFLNMLHLTAAIVDSIVQWAGLPVQGSFVVMLLLEGFLEHGTSALLFMVLLFTSSFCKELRLLSEEQAGMWLASGGPGGLMPHAWAVGVDMETCPVSPDAWVVGAEQEPPPVPSRRPSL